MVPKITLTLVALILLFTSAGCGPIKSSDGNSSSDKSQGTAPSSDVKADPADNQQLLPIVSGDPANLQLDASANGTTQQVEKGDVISINLEFIPSTGYGWIASISDQSVLTQVGGPAYLEPMSNSSTPIVGAPGTQILTFQALESGIATLTLDYKRSWETDVAPEKTIIIRVEVK